jgi:hypothetical protein
MHNPPPRDNAGENESNLSLFKGQLASASGWSRKALKIEELRAIMLYMLTNLDELNTLSSSILHPTPSFFCWYREFHRQF